MVGLTAKEKEVYRKRLKTFLENTPGFKSLPPDHLEALAQRVEIQQFKQGEIIIEQGAPPDAFYMILDGQVRVVDEKVDPPQLLNYLSESQFFGERGLLYKQPRAAQVDVAVDTYAARFDKETWGDLISTAPQIAEYFARVEDNYDQSRRIPFPGRHADEVAVLDMSRHWLALVMKLWGPITILITGLLGVYGLEVFFLPPLPVLGIATFLVLIASALAFWYQYEEWRNDSFIVSTKRVIHIERTILYGEQRDEAPLVTINDVFVDTPNFITSYFDYSNVLIRTAGAGDVNFSGMKDGQKIKKTIFAQSALAKDRVDASNIATIRRSIAERMYWQADHDFELPPLPAEIVTQPGQEEKPRSLYDRLPWIIRYYIPRLQERDGSQITWRKHWWVLLKMVSLPIITNITMFFLLIAAGLNRFPFHDTGSEFDTNFLIYGSIVWLLTFLWYTYHYDDWYRDLYIVTDTQLVVVDSTAFGLFGDKRQETTFNNIQNTNYESPNFFSRMLNMGNIVIQTASVGDESNFAFEQVFNPREVQQEVFRRWYSYRTRMRQQERDKNAETFTTWLREYHKLATDLSEK